MEITNIINKLFSGINTIYHLTKYTIITYIERIYLLLIGVKIGGVNSMDGVRFTVEMVLAFK